MTYECILTAVHGDGPRKTGLITLNRPKALNALNDPLMDELGEALLAFDADDGIGCIVLTGSERAFAAGADIPTMLPHTFVSAFKSGLLSKNWETILQV
ncbi:MAG: enoyl-CoA hydratase-related protein, partial [Roseateles sp.]